MGKAIPAFTRPKTRNGPSQLGTSSSDQWDSLGLTHGRTLAGLASALWTLADGGRTLLPLAENRIMVTVVGAIASGG
jgi:hypothetical protein